MRVQLVRYGQFVSRFQNAMSAARRLAAPLTRLAVAGMFPRASRCQRPTAIRPENLISSMCCRGCASTAYSAVYKETRSPGCLAGAQQATDGDWLGRASRASRRDGKPNGTRT